MRERKERRVRERLAGRGVVAVEGGPVVGPAKYFITIWQEVHILPDGEEIEGLRSVEGTIDLLDGQPHAAVQRVGQSLVLTLEDNRRFPFFFSDSSGSVSARGALQ